MSLVNKFSSKTSKQALFLECGYSIKTEVVNNIYETLFAMARKELEEKLEAFSIKDLINEKSPKIFKLYLEYFSLIGSDAKYCVYNTLISIEEFLCIDIEKGMSISTKFIKNKLPVIVMKMPEIIKVDLNKNYEEIYYYKVLFWINQSYVENDSEIKISDNIKKYEIYGLLFSLSFFNKDYLKVNGYGFKNTVKTKKKLFEWNDSNLSNFNLELRNKVYKRTYLSMAGKESDKIKSRKLFLLFISLIEEQIFNEVNSVSFLE